jgi:hypothetical protein
MRTCTLVLVGVSLFSPLAARAQSMLRLEEAFLPDPHVVSVRAGGDVPVSFGDCDYGYIAETAAVEIDYETSGSSDLFLYVEGDGDTMLLVETPSREILCDDDSHGNLNPIVHIPNAEDGLYLVFVGSFSDRDYQDATLYVSELDPGSAGGVPDIFADPRYGVLELREKFSGERSMQLTAGGSLPVGIPSCSYGYVSENPDLNVRYATSGGTHLYVYARSSVDTTLLVNLPDGSWVCDDDTLGNGNPIVAIPRAADGLYRIWVGTYGSQTSPATLYVSEQNPR